jgi:hypothetical protein
MSVAQLFCYVQDAKIYVHASYGFDKLLGVDDQIVSNHTKLIS